MNNFRWRTPPFVLVLGLLVGGCGCDPAGSGESRPPPPIGSATKESDVPGRDGPGGASQEAGGGGAGARPAGLGGPDKAR